MSERLTQADVARLKADKSAPQRQATATKVAAHFQEGRLNEAERGIAEEIFRFLARDAAVRVRQALCEHLKACRNVPHDVALALARDCESVSLPMLEFSEVLSDEDLIEIVHSQNAAKQKAIARRARVSAPVSVTLVECENVDVVTTLVGNPGAEISERTMHKVVADFLDNDKVQNLLAEREALPVTVAERLVGLVSYSVRQHLISHYDLPVDEAGEVVLQTRERAILSLLGPRADAAKVERLARHLYANGHLTPSLLLRAMSMGEFTFFEMGMALMAQVPLDTVRARIYDKGALGFTEIYEQAALPSSLLPAYLAGIDVIRQAEGGDEDLRSRFHRHMLWAIRTQYPDVRAANFEELLDKLIQPSS